MAMLHEKELVLNKTDTENILDAVKVMRTVMASVSGNMVTRLGDLKSGLAAASSNNSSEQIDQNVHI